MAHWIVANRHEGLTCGSRISISPIYLLLSSHNFLCTDAPSTSRSPSNHDELDNHASGDTGKNDLKLKKIYGHSCTPYTALRNLRSPATSSFRTSPI